MFYNFAKVSDEKFNQFIHNTVNRSIKLTYGPVTLQRHFEPYSFKAHSWDSICLSVMYHAASLDPLTELINTIEFLKTHNFIDKQMPIPQLKGPTLPQEIRFPVKDHTFDPDSTYSLSKIVVYDDRVEFNYIGKNLDSLMSKMMTWLENLALERRGVAIKPKSRL